MYVITSTIFLNKKYFYYFATCLLVCCISRISGFQKSDQNLINNPLNSCFQEIEKLNFFSNPSNSPYIPKSHTPMKSLNTPTSESLTLKGFVRGHKCLLDDTEIHDGNIVYLLRGADASQRLLYPLEIETNKVSLPGASSALKMYNLGIAAIDFSIKSIFEKFKDIEPSSSIGELLKEDMSRYHRILQYSVAGKLEANFLRPEALQYNLELYDEINMHYPALEKGIWAFKDFYQTNLEKEEFENHFLKSWTYLWDRISHMKNFGSKEIKNNPTFKSKLENPPEPGTLTPLVVDINSINIGEFPEETQEEVKRFLENRTKTRNS